MAIWRGLRWPSLSLVAAAVLGSALAASSPMAAQGPSALCGLLPPTLTTQIIGSDEPPAGDETSCMWLSPTALILVELTTDDYAAERVSRPGGEIVELAGVSVYRFDPDSPDVDASLVLVPYGQRSLLVTVMSIADPGVDVVPVSLQLAEVALAGGSSASAEVIMAQPTAVALPTAVAVSTGGAPASDAAPTPDLATPEETAPVRAEAVPVADGSFTPGLATPEEAVREYLAGVIDADVPRILGASAIDEVAEGFSFEEQTERINAFVPASRMAPADHPFWIEMNRATRTSETLDKVRFLVYSLLADETFDGSVIHPVDRAWAEAFAEQVDPARLAAITLLDVGIGNREMLESEFSREFLAGRAKTLGVDELTERVALLSFEDDLYIVGFAVARIGDTWKVLEQGAAQAGTDALGIAAPTTADAWKELTEGG